MITAMSVISRLPPYIDEWELIKEEQYVPDIMKEVAAAHGLFSGYYDDFSDLFYNRSASAVADTLYWFCKEHIRYKEESVEMQTSALPTGILTRGYGDCKHYSLFCAGVIASLNRLYNCCYEADFYFVAYDGATDPYHVYVCVKDGDRDIWLDPTPGSGGTPTLIKRKPV